MATDTASETASVMRKALALAQSQLSNYKSASTGLRAVDGRRDVVQGKSTPQHSSGGKTQKK